MATNDEIVRELITAYWMEIETVQNYLANSANMEGILAEEIREALELDLNEEFGHARKLAKRIHVIGGTVPGSRHFKAEQLSLQPPAKSTDLLSVIKGVIAAEESAIKQYRKIIQLCDGQDYATQDLCIHLLSEEEEHCRLFAGFLVEFETQAARPDFARAG